MKKATPDLKTSTPFMRSVGHRSLAQSLRDFLRITGPGPQKRHRAGKISDESCRHLRRLPHAAKFYWCAQPIALSRRLAQRYGPLGEAIPNITPDKETGIGDWKREEIAELLLTGVKPDFDNVQGLMEEVIRGTTHGYKDMTKEDALAIADYLKSIPAIKNVIK